MYAKNSLQELIAQNCMYQFFSDKLDVSQKLYHKTIKDVCSELNLNSDLIFSLLKSYDDNFDFPYKELNRFGITEILNYLKLTHRYYLNKKLPEIEQTIIQLYNNYSDSHKLLVLLSMFFIDYKKKLEEHIKYEEQKLFPYIQKLAEIETGNQCSTDILSVLNQFSAKIFIENHTDIEEDLQEVRKTILKYSGSGKTPLPYNVFLAQLQYFEVDLCKHAMIEDNVLMPKVIELEAQLLKKAAQETLNKFHFR